MGRRSSGCIDVLFHRLFLDLAGSGGPDWTSMDLDTKWWVLNFNTQEVFYYVVHTQKNRIDSQRKYSKSSHTSAVQNCECSNTLTLCGPNYFPLFFSTDLSAEIHLLRDNFVFVSRSWTIF